MPLNTLGQWFEVYGKAKDGGVSKEQLTQFHAMPRVYGGTAHHRAFKSQGSTMKVGRCTR